MSASHLKLLRHLLEQSHWRIDREEDHLWIISRPDGSSPLRIAFEPWYGAMGEWRRTSIEHSLGCEVVGFSELSVYFGRYSGRFQTDIREFIAHLGCTVSGPGSGRAVRSASTECSRG